VNKLCLSCSPKRTSLGCRVKRLSVKAWAAQVGVEMKDYSPSAQGTIKLSCSSIVLWTTGAERGTCVGGVSGTWWGAMLFGQNGRTLRNCPFVGRFVMLSCIFRHTQGVSKSWFSYGWGSSGQLLHQVWARNKVAPRLLALDNGYQRTF